VGQIHAAFLRCRFSAGIETSGEVTALLRVAGCLNVVVRSHCSGITHLKKILDDLFLCFRIDETAARSQFVRSANGNSQFGSKPYALEPLATEMAVLAKRRDSHAIKPSVAWPHVPLVEAET